MILIGKGKLSTAQAISGSSMIPSSNVIDIGALDRIAPFDIWVVVETAVVAAGNATATYSFVVTISSEVGLTGGTTRQVLGVVITGSTDDRMATVGKNILAVNIGKMLAQLCTAATYRYLGVAYTLGAGTGTAPTISVNTAVSNSEPSFLPGTQVVDSNVTVPAICSAGSGLD